MKSYKDRIAYFERVTKGLFNVFYEPYNDNEGTIVLSVGENDSINPKWFNKSFIKQIRFNGYGLCIDVVDTSYEEE